MKYSILLAAGALLLAPANASAQSLNIKDLSSPFDLKVTSINAPAVTVLKEAPKKASTPAPILPVTPVVYEVKEGDNLSKIGSAHGVEWQRLFAKNLQIEHPDMIKVGEKLTIPAANEVLSREIPAAVALPAITPGVLPFVAPEPARRAPVASAPAPAAAPAPARMSFSGGNSYDYGYCTWYVKNRRGSSIPDNLGNANTWYSRAAGQGMAVGSVPAAGAVGTTTRGQYGHVVYVESVNPDGSINISEMNRNGFGVTSSRTASASEFVYIY